MPDRIVSHALEQVEESHDVAVDVGIGVFDRIAYAGLCRQIDDGIEFFSSGTGFAGPVGLRGAFG